LRHWVRQARRDSRLRPGLTTDERRRLKELERENRELAVAGAVVYGVGAFAATFLVNIPPHRRARRRHARAGRRHPALGWLRRALDAINHAGTVASIVASAFCRPPSWPSTGADRRRARPRAQEFTPS
jgi:hypothetical protein